MVHIRIAMINVDAVLKPAFLCMTANFKRGRDGNEATSIQYATFSFQAKDPSDR